MAQFFVDGQPESKKFAWQVLWCTARDAGYDVMEIAAMWGRAEAATEDGETARDDLSAICDAVEIVA